MNASVQRAYRLFRTMGLRHLPVVNHDNVLVGMITRQDVTEHRLHEKWHHEGSEMQKHVNVEVLAPAMVHPNDGLEDENGNRYDYFEDDDSLYADSSYAGSDFGEVEFRKGITIQIEINDCPRVYQDCRLLYYRSC
jgi:hypothetical protein